MVNRSFGKIAQAGKHPRLALPRATPINNRRGSTVKMTFSASALWVAPLLVRTIARVYGKGANGTPEAYSFYTRYGYRTYGTLHFAYTGQAWQSDPPIDYGWTEGTPVPQDYYTPVAQNGTDLQYFYHYQYEPENQVDTSYTPAAPGPGAAALERSFPGGGPNALAEVTRYNNVPVVPGTTYSFYIPTGGFITLEYSGL